MNKISINKDTDVRVDTFNWQTSPNGNKFRLSGLKKNSQIPTIYEDSKGKKVNEFTKGRIAKNHWIYEFIYEDGKHFYIEIDYNNKFLYLTKK